MPVCVADRGSGLPRHRNRGQLRPAAGTSAMKTGTVHVTASRARIFAWRGENDGPFAFVLVFGRHAACTVHGEGAKIGELPRRSSTGEISTSSISCLQVGVAERETAREQRGQRLRAVDQRIAPSSPVRRFGIRRQIFQVSLRPRRKSALRPGRIAADRSSDTAAPAPGR